LVDEARELLEKAAGVLFSAKVVLPSENGWRESHKIGVAEECWETYRHIRAYLAKEPK
jgi:hypothetical protein